MKYLLFILLFIWNAAFAGTGYHVKNGGNDAADGLTDATAWATIGKVNSESLAGTIVAGDSVLFKGGDTWTGNLVIRNSGTYLSRVVISSYGTGRPIISSGDSTAIRLLNCEYVTVTGMKVVGSGIDTTTGVTTNYECGIVATSTLTSGHAQWRNVVIHDNVVGNGYNGGFRMGILVEANYNKCGGHQTGWVGYDTVTITNNDVSNCGTGGIFTWAQPNQTGFGPKNTDSVNSTWPSNYYGELTPGMDCFSHFYLGYNYVHDIYGWQGENRIENYYYQRSGAGIRILNMNHYVVEWNKVNNCGNMKGTRWVGGGLGSPTYYAYQTPANMEAQSTKNGIWQYNESSNCRMGENQVDGAGMDVVESSCDSLVVQYNYVHDNDGYAFGLGNNVGLGMVDDYNVIRFNISANNNILNFQGDVHINGPTNGLYIHNNLFYNTNPADAGGYGAAFVNLAPLTTDSVRRFIMANNIVYHVGSGRSYFGFYDYTPRPLPVGNVYYPDGKFLGGGMSLAAFRTVWDDHMEMIGATDYGRIIDPVFVNNTGAIPSLDLGDVQTLDYFDYTENIDAELSASAMTSLGFPPLPPTDYKGNTFSPDSLKAGPFQTNFTGNIHPNANAGSDATVTYPTSNTVNLDATGSTDADGTISTYAWSIISGSGGSIADASDPTTTFTGTYGNVYTIRLTVTDNDGGTDTDDKIITVNKASQTITFGTLSNKVVGDAPFSLTGTASSSLTVSYASSNTSVATVSGSTVTIVGAGTTNITASQSGDGNYSAASNVVRSLTVTSAGGSRLNIRWTKVTVPTGAHPLIGDEFVKSNYWFNVKTVFGAAGNGISDDTEELQAAFNALNENDTATIFLPTGTYNISEQLLIYQRINVTIIGEDSNTVIKWVGDTSTSSMILFDGLAYSKISRITFDGDHKIRVLVNQSWTGGHDYFDTGNEYSECIFKNAGWVGQVTSGSGLDGGWSYNGFAEVSIMRCKFRDNVGNGISTGNQNALDVWVWFCEFTDNLRGINSYQGNFHVYYSIFKRNTEDDLIMQFTSVFTVIGNYSEGSNEFFASGFTQNSANIYIKGNTVVDCTTRPIRIASMGPVEVIDNVFKCLDTNDEIVLFVPPIVGYITMIGNVYTPTIYGLYYMPGATDDTMRLLIDNNEVTRASLMVSEPTQEPYQSDLARTVFYVPAGAITDTIQAIINRAALLDGQRPAVIFPTSTYLITQQINVPPCDVQLIGNGHSTALIWDGEADDTTSYVIRFQGPSKATLRDIIINGLVGTATNGILVEGADQANGRVYIHELEASWNTESSLRGDTIDYTNIYAVNSGFYYNSGGTAIWAKGGNAHGGRTVIMAGQGASNGGLQFNVTGGGSMYVGPYWCETGGDGKFIQLTDSGTFSMVGGLLATPKEVDLLDPDSTAMRVNGFKGKVVAMGTHFYDKLKVTGDGSAAKVLSLGNLTFQYPWYINNASPAAQTGFLMNMAENDWIGAGASPITNDGDDSSSFIEELLQEVRDVLPPILTKLPNGVTDFRMFRVGITQCKNAVVIKK